jgi:hypothetical protein
MHKQGHLALGQQTVARTLRTTARLVPRVLLLALMLALAIGSIGQPQPTQAAQPAEENTGSRVQRPWVSLLGQKNQHKFELMSTYVGVKRRPKGPYCPKRTYTYVVEVSAKYSHTGRDGRMLPDVSAPLTGMYVNSSSGDTSIGTISPPRYFAGMAAFDDNPHEYDFNFAAKQAGKTTLTFSADLPHVGDTTGAGNSTTGSTVEVTVVNCKFKVSTNSLWTVPGPAQITLAATISGANVTCNDQYQCKGSATVTWGGSVAAVRDCSGSVKAKSSKVDLKGDIGPSGELNMTLKYTASTVTLKVDCGEAGGKSYDRTVTPDPLSISVPNEGSSRKQKHALGGAGAQGATHITVSPDKS